MQIASELQEAGLNQEQVQLLWQVYQEARGQLDTQRKENSEGVHAPGLALGVVGQLLTILHLMYQVHLQMPDLSSPICQVVADFEGQVMFCWEWLPRGWLRLHLGCRWLLLCM